MNKKVFYQGSIILYIVIVLLFAIIAAAVYVLVVLFTDGFNINDWFYWIVIGACCGIVLLMGYKIISFLRNRIILYDDEIFVPGHWGDQKVQYELHIRYCDIKDIRLVASDKDSKGQSVFGVFVQMPYIIFEGYDGKQKAVNVYYYSKKQVASIIDLAVDRAKKQGNELNLKSGLELIKEFIAGNKKIARIK